MITKILGGGNKKNPSQTNEGKKKEQTPLKSGQKGLSYDQIHGKNRFDDALEQTELTKAYSVAEQKLKEKSYAERKFKTKENIIKIRGLYPYLSVFLSLSVGILTGDLFASGLSDVAYYLTLGILTVAVFLVAWLLEDLKRDACRDYFSSTEQAGRQRFWLNSLFMYSVLISGIGGYVASIHLNDRTAEIEQIYQTQSDSVNTGYGEQIAVLNTIINENQKRMQSPSKWTRYHAQKDLTEAQKQKTELLKLQNNTLSDIKTEKKAELTAGDLLNQYKAYIIVLVVLLLETLYIRSYAYEYAVERKIKTENRRYEYVSPPTETLPGTEPLTLQDVAMQMLLANITGMNQGQMQGQGVTPAVIQSNLSQIRNAYSQSGNVGFQIGQQTPKPQPEKSDEPEKKDLSKNIQFNENLRQVVPEKSQPKPHIEVEKDENPKRVRNCKQCGKEFEYQHWNAQYCSDACRMQNWEERKGRKLKKKKKND